MSLEPALNVTNHEISSKDTNKLKGRDKLFIYVKDVFEIRI